MRDLHVLNESEIELAIKSLKGWSFLDGKLHKEIKLKNFSAAIGFMTEVAMEVHRLDHHPEWCNVYNKIVIDLVTHDVGGISELDIKLANIIDSLLE